MSWIPPGIIPDGAYRFLMCSGGVMCLFGAGWLLATAPSGRFTVLGLLLAVFGAVLLRNWWKSR